MSIAVMFLSGMTANALAQSRAARLTNDSKAKQLSPKEVVVKHRETRKEEANTQESSRPSTSASRRSVIFYGPGINSVPYLETFEDQTAFNSFLVLDNNTDGSTWSFYSRDACARYNYSKTNDADDWLLTPLIHMEGGKSYFFSFKYRRGYSSPERLAVAWGTGDDPTTYTVLDEGFDIPDTDETFSKEVTVRATGDYRFGIHAISPKGKFYIAVDDVAVEEGSHIAAPDSVTSLTVTPDATGALAAQISFTTPSVNGEGGTITSLTKVEVLRNDELIHTFTAPDTGEQLTFNAAGGNYGMNKFTVIAYNESGAGRLAERNMWLGIDIPTAPRNIVLTDNGSTLTTDWEAPLAIGANGGVVIPSDLTYNVYNWGEDKIGSGIEETEFLDDDAVIGGKVRIIQYYVTAQNEMGESAMGESNWLVTGDPYYMPVTQSFENGSMGSLYWWIPPFVLPCWHLTRDLSYDNDGGSLLFYAEKPGDEGWFNSAKISSQGEANPHVTLAYYAYPGKQNKLEVIASKMQKDDLVLASIDFSTLSGEEGWRTIRLSLDGTKDVNYFVLRLHAVCNDLDYPVVVDAMEIKDIKNNDLAALITVPDMGKMNEASEITVRVSNEGSNAAQNYAVNLYCGDELVETQNSTEALEPAAVKNYTFSYTPTVYSETALMFHAVVELASDEVLNNNTTERLEMVVVKNDHFPGVDDLTGTKNGSSVSLSWTTPEQPEQAVEDFDSYNAWSINFIGPWTLVDGDQAYTYGINGVNFPHYGDQFAYIVFNPEAAGLDLEENPMIAPHSGSQFLACMAADPEYTSLGHNDDWLISPLLTGEAQTIRFWAKSLFATYLETFEVLYSTTDASTGSLTANALTVNTVPDEWTEYSVELPAGAKYFAIHCTSADKFMLMLDDITYAPKPLTLTGYNIYRDGILIGTVDATSTGYDDTTAGDDVHNYQVTAVYEEGESGLSNVFSTSTGIGNVTGTQVSIVGQTGQIVVNGAENTMIRVYTADGALHRSTVGGASNVIRLTPGLYVVKAGTQVRRVVVR